MTPINLAPQCPGGSILTRHILTLVFISERNMRATTQFQLAFVILFQRLHTEQQGVDFNFGCAHVHSNDVLAAKTTTIASTCASKCIRQYAPHYDGLAGPVDRSGRT